MHTKCREVRFSKRRLLCIQAFKQGLHLPCLFGGRNKRIEMLIKSNQSGLVILAHGNIREHKRGIDSIVQQCHSLKGLLHNAFLINHIVYLLRTLILVYIHHQLMPPGTGFPVDSTVIVPFHILFYLLEFSLMSYSPDLLDTQFRKIIAHSKQFITMKHQIGRIYFYLLPFTAGQTTLD